MIAVSDSIWESPPKLDDPGIRNILILTHDSWHLRNSRLARHWVYTPPPSDLQMMGYIEELPEEIPHLGSAGTWEFLTCQILMQWRWDHDRETVLAEDEIRKKAELQKRAEAEKRRAALLATASFSDLLGRDLFQTWNDIPPKAVKEGCVRIIRSFIQSLANNGKPLKRRVVNTELKKCVKELNTFSAQNHNFIETVEREDLILLLEEILAAAKFPDLVDAIDKWRDW